MTLRINRYYRFFAADLVYSVNKITVVDVRINSYEPCNVQPLRATHIGNQITNH